MICSDCGHDFEGNFCPNCGAPAPQKVVCSSCGTEFEGNFCPECGQQVEVPIDVICRNLYDLNGNYIDVERLAGLYVSVSELKGFFKRCTNYTREEAEELSEYIYQFVDGYDFGIIEAAVEKRKMEEDARALTPVSTPSSIGNAASYYYANQDFPAPVSSPPPTPKARQKPLSKRQRIRENKRNAVAGCPRCGSTSLSANKKGFSFVKGAIGGGIGAVVAPIGIVMGLGAGNIGAKKVWVTCLNCGHRWKM